MKVILKKTVEKVGKKDEVKEVSAGFARNFLIPNGEAKLATEANLKELAKKMALKEKAPKKDKKGKKVRKKKVKKAKSKK